MVLHLVCLNRTKNMNWKGWGQTPRFFESQSRHLELPQILRSTRFDVLKMESITHACRIDENICTDFREFMIAFLSSKMKPQRPFDPRTHIFLLWESTGHMGVTGASTHEGSTRGLCWRHSGLQWRCWGWWPPLLADYWVPKWVLKDFYRKLWKIRI